MFRKGEFVIYGNSGVCEVVDIGTMDMSGAKTVLYAASGICKWKQNLHSGR